jgi:acyl-coenzyme A thioesterase PaaI-like protein
LSNSLRKANRLLWLFGVFKIPLIAFCNPKIVELSQEKIVVRIRLNWRTRNHLKSLYLGVFAIGADLAGGFHAFWLGRKNKRNISLAFKDLNADFIKRAESDVFFVANSGNRILDLFQKSLETGERHTMSVPIEAFTNYYNNPELVAKFSIGLSIKDKGRG